MSPTADYIERVNRAIDHITHNLDAPLGLDELARVACFSRFHFHRVFKLMTGETVQQFVNRVRLERALYLLSHGKVSSMTRVALRCGFASSSDFSRSFKRRYGAPPSAIDLPTFRQAHRVEMQRRITPELRGQRLDRLPPGANPDGFEMRIRALPARTVAYIRVHRPYAGSGVYDAAQALVAWAESRGWADGQWLGYQWDDPEIVALDACRYDVGVTVPASFRAEGRVGRLALPAMQVAELALDGDIGLEMRALDWIFGTWLPRSAFVPDDQPCFEAWRGRPYADGTERFRLRLQLPVAPAG